jgi:hypothetical protein
MFNYSLKIATAACLVGSAALGVVSPAPAEASTIGVCNASTIGRTSQIQQVIEKSAPGSSSSGREFTNSWTFVAPDGYMISSVNVKKLKGGSNTSYSEKWLPSGGSFSSRTQFNNAYSESLNLLAQYRGSQGYERASLDYQNKESQMSNWYNQVNSGQQGSYEFKMSVRHVARRDRPIRSEHQFTLHRQCRCPKNLLQEPGQQADPAIRTEPLIRRTTTWRQQQSRPAAAAGATH